jgi:hypothetical protein
LQQGIYQIHFSGSRFNITPGGDPFITANLNPQLAVNAPFWVVTVPISEFVNYTDVVGGDRVVSVGPNTTLTFSPIDTIRMGICELIITKLQ